MMVDYGKIEVEINRTLNWHVTLPAYREHGWQPTVDSLEAGISFLRDSLDDRLIGIDFFRLGWLMDDQFDDIRTMLIGYDWGEEGTELEPEIPFEQRPEPERWQIVGEDLRQRGVIDGS